MMQYDLQMRRFNSSTLANEGVWRRFIEGFDTKFHAWINEEICDNEMLAMVSDFRVGTTGTLPSSKNLPSLFQDAWNIEDDIQLCLNRSLAVSVAIEQQDEFKLEKSIEDGRGRRLAAYKNVISYFIWSDPNYDVPSKRCNNPEVNNWLQSIVEDTDQFDDPDPYDSIEP